MHVLLINPADTNVQGYHAIGSKIPHLGLQVLAQRTPPQYQLDIVDEIFGPDRTIPAIQSGKYDLIGMTAYTCGVTRAYELAHLCRQAKIPTILGGPHAWACPDEAAGHFDSVAVGECDEVWPQILHDAAAGKLQRRYMGGFPELTAGLGRAAQHVQPINGTYDVATIQTSRGCPIGCDFCSVTRFNGGQIRRRNIDQIVEEWNAAPKRSIFVVDDNFFGVGPAHAASAKQLLQAIIQRGKRKLWFSQTSINMGDDPEGLRLAYKAGCRGMLVGIESFNEGNLQAFHKGVNKNNLSRYKELVGNFHKAGIAVFGAFIIGGRNDTPETVTETVLQAVRIGVDIVQITSLTPLPGTALFDRLMGEGRILAKDFPTDWRRYTFIETVFQPDRMTADQLDEEMYKLRSAAAVENWVWKQTIRTFLATRSLTTAIFVHLTNRGWKRLARGQVAQDAQRFGKVYTKHEIDPRLRRAFRLVGA